MKKKTLILLILIFIAGIASSVFADETGTEKSEGESLVASSLPVVSDEMISVLVGNLDNIFPISSQKQNFSTPEEGLYSDVGQDTVVRMETALGKRNIVIFANSDSVHDYSGFTPINDAYPTDFQITMDVTLQDVFPEKQGGCFIGFTNYGVSAFSGAEGAVTVQLLITGKTSEIYVRNHDEDSGEHIILGDLNRKAVKMSLVHLTEHTYVFLNGSYAGQYHDGKSGPLQMIFGATVFSEGDTASCTFDNLNIRKAYK